MRPAVFLGLMSGTSQDGVDAVVASFDNGRLKRVMDHCSVRYPPPLRKKLLALADGTSSVSLAEYATLDAEVARHFVRAAGSAMRRCSLRASQVAAIGSHGQTVFHDPDGTANSLQLGNPSLIAQKTGITTVADFRRADIAHGGQGAPLVPAFHASQFSDRAEARVVVNLGGIANVSILPRRGPVTGFDTGPGNALLDEWIQKKLKRPLDRAGRWAAGGRVVPQLLDALLADRWFRKKPPKSTGRDRFNLGWVRQRFPRLSRLDPADVQRTLLELTVVTVAQAIQQHAPATRRVILCGGGIRNTTLVTALQMKLMPVALESTEKYGLDPQLVEATAFAWLAMRTLNGEAGNVPSVTGAGCEAILGGIYPATRSRTSSRSRR